MPVPNRQPILFRACARARLHEVAQPFSKPLPRLDTICTIRVKGRLMPSRMYEDGTEDKERLAASAAERLGFDWSDPEVRRRALELADRPQPGRLRCLAVVLGGLLLFVSMVCMGWRISFNMYVGSASVVLLYAGMPFAVVVVAVLVWIAIRTLREWVFTGEHRIGGCLMGALLMLVAVLCVIFALVNPLLDIPCLSSPSYVQLTDIRTDDSDSDFPTVSGTAEDGSDRSFTVDCASQDAMRGAKAAYVEYLPHTGCVLRIEKHPFR